MVVMKVKVMRIDCHCACGGGGLTNVGVMMRIVWLFVVVVQ